MGYGKLVGEGCWGLGLFAYNMDFVVLLKNDEFVKKEHIAFWRLYCVFE